MAKTPKFTIRQGEVFDDVADFERLKRNAKAKFRRLEKRGITPDIDLQIPKNIEQFASREAFNQWKEMASSFTNRHNLHYQYVQGKKGAYMNKVEYNEAVRENKRQQKQAIEEFKKVQDKPFRSGGVEQDTTVGERLEELKNQDTGIATKVRDFNLDNYPDQKSLQNRLDAMKRRSSSDYYDKRKEVLKTNFINTIQAHYNSDADDVIEKMKSLPADLFYQLFLSVQEFDFAHYDSDGQSTASENEKLAYLRAEVDRALDNSPSSNVDPDLKGFN